VARTYDGPPFDDAKVYDAMRVGVVTCRPETKLADVARIMVGYDIHSVVVSEVPGKADAWGIVTSLDLARRPDEIDSLTAVDVASTDLVTIPSDAPLRRAAEVIAEHGVTHLVAV
jgi:CBS domain-containing protein